MSEIKNISGINMSTILNKNVNEQLDSLCVHAIGLGKAGCETVVELLTRPQIEDQLVNEAEARIAVLCIDIGDRDLHKVRRAASGLKQRLENRGIKAEDKMLIKTWNMKPPVTEEEEDEFYGSLMNLREYFKVEYPRNYWNPNYEPWTNADDDVLPKENEHTYRSVAKSLYYDEYYRKGLKEAVVEFCDYINDTMYPGIIYMFFGLAGGFGSGIAIDLARHISVVKLGHRQIFCGFGYLPSHRDEEIYQHTPNVMSTMMELECYINKEANEATASGWGDNYWNPFTGGFYVIPREAMAVRTRAIDVYFDGKIPNSVVQHRKEGARHVIDRNIDLSLVDFLVDDYTRHFRRVAACNGQISSPWNQVDVGERCWNIILITQFMHGACEVSPAVNGQNLRDELVRYMRYLANYDDMDLNFKTDYIHVDVYGSDTIVDDDSKKAFDTYFNSRLLEGGTCEIDYHLAYDEMNSWFTAMIPGVALADMVEFVKSRDIYDSIDDWTERLHSCSSLLEMGPMIEEPSIRQKGLAGECIWGCACYIGYPYERLRGEGEYPPHRPEIFAKTNELFEEVLTLTMDKTEAIEEK